MPDPTPPKLRIVPRTPAEQIQRRNLPVNWFQDLYHRALSLRWRTFLWTACLAYLLVNVLFALLYLAEPGGVAGARPGSFADAFFFSIQTIATIGYGQMYPNTLYTNLLVTFETMTGLVILALLTGITFARISRPTARVMFARHAVIGPYNGTPTLSFRLGNQRRSQILEADVAVTLLRYETSAEGITMRRFYDLHLVRRHTPVFALTFSILHPIDEHSPLHGCTPQSLAAEEAEILISVTGLEEVTSQTVHARHSYEGDEVLFHHRFAGVFRTAPDGTKSIDYADFHNTIPLDER